MAGCNGNCGACSGCARQLKLTQGELDILMQLGQIPFLPIARKADDMTPVYLEDETNSREEYSLILQVLEKKGLVSLDYDKPLSGMDMSRYKGLPVHGSMALTAKGQTVLEMIELQGMQE